MTKPRLKTQINDNLNINIDEKFDYERTINYLSANGYARVSSIRENGEFSVKGDVIDIFPTDFKNPVRINIFGDEIEKFEEFFEINLNSEEVESIGGFALKKFGHLPKVGESFEDYDLRFTVTSADQRKIKKITVRKID